MCPCVCLYVLDSFMRWSGRCSRRRGRREGSGGGPTRLVQPQGLGQEAAAPAAGSSGRAGQAALREPPGVVLAALCAPPWSGAPCLRCLGWAKGSPHSHGVRVFGDLRGTHGTRGAFLSYSARPETCPSRPRPAQRGDPGGGQPTAGRPPRRGAHPERSTCLRGNRHGTPAGGELWTEDDEDDASDPGRRGLSVVPAAPPRVPLPAGFLCSQSVEVPVPTSGKGQQRRERATGHVRGVAACFRVGFAGAQ